MVATKKTPLYDATAPKPAHFEAAYAELEALVMQMEAGDMALNDALHAYQRGNFLLQFCQNALTDVEQQVQLLTSKNTLEAFTPQAD